MAGAINGTLKTCGNDACKQTGYNFQTCSKCESIYYHAKECQKKHWKAHKLECKGLADKKIEKIEKRFEQKAQQAIDFLPMVKIYQKLDADRNIFIPPSTRAAYTKELLKQHAKLIKTEQEYERLKRLKQLNQPTSPALHKRVSIDEVD